MGMVKVRAEIGLREGALREVEFLVDSGSFYTILPPDLGQELGIRPTVTSTVVTADSRKADIGLGMALLRLMDREGGVPVGILEVPMPLLGVTALGLKIDPVEERLEYSRPFGPAALAVLRRRRLLSP